VNPYLCASLASLPSPLLSVSPSSQPNWISLLSLVLYSEKQRDPVGGGRGKGEIYLYKYTRFVLSSQERPDGFILFIYLFWVLGIETGAPHRLIHAPPLSYTLSPS
jgi:hypothetical protein